MKKYVGIIALLVIGLLSIGAYMLWKPQSNPDVSGLGQNKYQNFEYDYTAGEQELVLDCRFPNPIVETVKGKSTLSIAGLTNSMDGYQLPVHNVVLALPMNTTVTTITVKKEGTTEIKNITLKEADLGTLATSSESDDKKNSADKINFSVQEKQGYKFVIFSVHPCEYLKSDHTVRFSPDITVTVALSDDVWNVNQINQETVDYLKDKVDNPEMIDSYGVETTGSINQLFCNNEQGE